MSRKTAKRRRAHNGEFTPLEERFCYEYVVDFMGGPALRRAGSTAKHPDQQAYEMLRKPHIARRVHELIAQQNEKAIVNKQWVMTELVMTYRAATAASLIPGGNSAERSIALRALEKIGMHVDVAAFRAQIGVGNPDGSHFDLSGLNDEQLDQLETLLAAAALSGGGSGGEGPTVQ